MYRKFRVMQHLDKRCIEGASKTAPSSPGKYVIYIQMTNSKLFTESFVEVIRIGDRLIALETSYQQYWWEFDGGLSIDVNGNTVYWKEKIDVA